MSAYLATAVNAYNGIIQALDIAMLDSTHVVVVYSITSGAYEAVIGTISGGTISFGTPVTIFATAGDVVEVAVLDSTHFVVMYKGSGDLGTVRCGSVSGTTITFGTAQSFTGSALGGGDICMLSSTLFAITYGQSGNYFWHAICGTISGTTITMGTTEEISQSYSINGSTTPISIAMLSSTKFIIACQDVLVCCTVSGTTITDGTITSSYTGIGGPTGVSVTGLSATLGVVAMWNLFNFGRAYSFTVSGTTITINTGVQWCENTSQEYVDVNFINSTTFYLTGRDISNGIAINRVGVISGSTIIFGPNTTGPLATQGETAVISGALFVNLFKYSTVDNKLYAQVGVISAGVTVSAPSPLGSRTGTANGNIIYDSGTAITRRGFCYMLGSGTPTTSDSEVHQDSADYNTGAYTLSLTGLRPGNLYSIRAYVVTPEGTSYSDVIQFTALLSILNFTGFEAGTNSNKGNGGYDTQPFAGTDLSYDTSTKRTGAYSLRLNKVTTGVGSMVMSSTFQANGIVSTSGGNFPDMYAEFYFRIATAPASLNEDIFQIRDANGDIKIYIRLDSARKLSIYDGTPTIIGSAGATVLALNTQYRISLYVGTGASAAWVLKINGVTELSGTINDTDANRNASIGCLTDRNGQSMDVYYDDVVLSDEGFIAGEYAIKVIPPVANGSTMQATAGGSPQDYTQVDDIPRGDASSVYLQFPNSGAPNVALFDMQSCASAGISGSILALKAVIQARENTSVSSQSKVRIKSGSTNLETTTYNATTAAEGRTIVSNYNPDTGADWDLTTLDAAEIGMVENNNQLTRLANVMGYVLYIPSTTNIKSMNGLARASIKSVNGLAIASVKSKNALA